MYGGIFFITRKCRRGVLSTCSEPFFIPDFEQLNKKFFPYLASHENCFSVRVSMRTETAIYFGFRRKKGKVFSSKIRNKSGFNTYVEIRNKKQFCHVRRGIDRNFHYSKSGIKAVLNTWTHLLDSLLRNQKDIPRSGYPVFRVQ